jgi:predicted esterase
LLSAHAPEVRSAVALAPWVLPTDRPGDVAGRPILIVHGSHDRIADPRRSIALAERLGRDAEVTYVCVEDGRHAMLRRHALFDGLAAQFAARTLLDGPKAGPLAQIADGEPFIRL